MKSTWISQWTLNSIHFSNDLKDQWKYPLELASCNCKLNSPGKLLKKVRYTLIEIHLNKLTNRKSNPLVNFLKRSLKKYSTWMAIRESLELCGDLYIPSWVISYFSHHLRKASLCVIRSRDGRVYKRRTGGPLCIQR